MIAEITMKMMEYFGTDVRRINHALKVYGFAKTIGTIEKLSHEDQKVLEIAALLHDIGIKEAERKYQSSAGHYQEMEGPAVAASLLVDFQMETSALERILFLIGHHHSYRCIDHLDFQILVEADFLVNIDEDRMNRLQVDTVLSKSFKTGSGIHLIKCCYNSPEASPF